MCEFRRSRIEITVYSDLPLVTYAAHFDRVIKIERGSNTIRVSDGHVYELSSFAHQSATGQDEREKIEWTIAKMVLVDRLLKLLKQDRFIE